MAVIRCGDRVFEQIQAIIFDKDGTLADSRDYLVTQAEKRLTCLDNHLKEILSPNAMAQLTDRLFQAWGMSKSQIHPAGLMAVGSRRDNEIATAGYIAALGFPWVEALTIVQTAFQEASQLFPRKDLLTPIVPQGRPCLDNLHSHGLHLGLLSADTTPNVKAFVQTYGLTPYISLAMGAQVGLSKPDPQLLQQACTEIGVPPSQTLVVGDSAADIELAKRAGAAGAIGVWGAWDQPFTIPNAHVMVESLAEITVLSAMG
ncbi:HAD family hydrolase [Alkalinema pantanalense CENA528]|uniref:HAD family hydrolase n=1 Tax=Alkalinema pantanalense TaxID=1620705 RepID=UPI003D6F3A63